MVDEVEKRVVAILEGLDETGNAVLGPVKDIPEAGNPHYTCSQRWAYERLKGNTRACVICKLLTIMFRPFFWGVQDYDHCSDAIKDFPTNLPSEG